MQDTPGKREASAWDPIGAEETELDRAEVGGLKQDGDESVLYFGKY
jgi:hypothetical protein